MSENKIINLEVNGIRYDGFTNITIQKSLDSAYGQFNFTATSEENILVPFKTGDECKVWIAEYLVITGYIERINISYSAETHAISIQGRDKISDLVDSSVIGNIDFKAPISLPQTIRLVLNSLGLTEIKIINQTSLNLENDFFTTEEDLAAEIGENAFEFLQKLCRKKQVLILSDGAGNILLTRAESDIATTTISNRLQTGNNNVLSGSVNFDTSKRYFAYVCRSQGNASSGLEDPNIDSKRGIAYDTGIRNTRTLEFQSESLSSIDSCEKRAIWESNVRRAKSANVNYTINSFFIDDYEEQGVFANLWDINQLVFVEDDFLNIYSRMLINSVTYTYSLDSGETTQLELIHPDAYLLEPSEDERKAKVDEVGNEINMSLIPSSQQNIDDWKTLVRNAGIDIE